MKIFRREKDDKEEVDVIAKLAILFSHMGNCVGRDGHEIDFRAIEGEARRRQRQRRDPKDHAPFREDRLRCFNPPDLIDAAREKQSVGSSSLLPSRSRGMEDLTKAFTYGFPFADSDEVPEDVLELWEQHNTRLALD